MNLKLIRMDNKGHVPARRVAVALRLARFDSYARYRFGRIRTGEVSDSLKAPIYAENPSWILLEDVSRSSLTLKKPTTSIRDKYWMSKVSGCGFVRSGTLKLVPICAEQEEVIQVLKKSEDLSNARARLVIQAFIAISGAL